MSISSGFSSRPLDLLLICPEEAEDNLALDAALFHEMEKHGTPETLRFWECQEPAVIVGGLGAAGREIHEEACAADNVPVLRRISGGGAVVVARGCLNYSLLLSLDSRPELRDIPASYAWILGRMVRSLNLPALSAGGASDLAFAGRKVSGNAQRRGRRALLHHGTVLYDFDSGLMQRYLKEPERQPAYRNGRSHADFVANLPLRPDVIRESIARAVRAPCGGRRRSGTEGGK